MLKLLNKTLSTKNQFRLRFYLARTEGFVHRLRFVNLKAPSMGWPILFGTSFPKSGTNLLAQILTGFSTVAPFAPHVSLNMGLGEIDPKQRGDLLEKQFASLRPLDIIMAHLPARQEMMDRIVSPLFLPYFIFRDPRDIVVSLVFYVTEIEKNHRLHAYYSETLKSMDERLMTTIQGVRVSGVVIPSIAKQIEAYMGWLDHPDVHSIRYEDLVRDQHPTLGAMADHFLKRIDSLPNTREEIMAKLETSINPTKSPTFRSGKTGEWKKYFTDEHRQVFKQVAGDLLIRLGYESSYDW